MNKNRVIKPSIRYSKAFKIQIVAELEREHLTVAEVKRKYGIRGDGTVEQRLLTDGRFVAPELKSDVIGNELRQSIHIRGVCSGDNRKDSRLSCCRVSHQISSTARLLGRWS